MSEKYKKARRQVKLLEEEKKHLINKVQTLKKQNIELQIKLKQDGEDQKLYIAELEEYLKNEKQTLKKQNIELTQDNKNQKLYIASLEGDTRYLRNTIETLKKQNTRLTEKHKNQELYIASLEGNHFNNDIKKQKDDKKDSDIKGFMKSLFSIDKKSEEIKKEQENISNTYLEKDSMNDSYTLMKENNRLARENKKLKANIEEIKLSQDVAIQDKEDKDIIIMSYNKVLKEAEQKIANQKLIIQNYKKTDTAVKPIKKELESQIFNIFQHHKEDDSYEIFQPSNGGYECPIHNNNSFDSFDIG